MVSQAGTGGRSGYAGGGEIPPILEVRAQMDKPHGVVGNRVVFSRRARWRAVCKAARDDIGRSVRRLGTLGGFTGAVRAMIGRFIGYFGVICGAAFGATVATWAQAPYPISILERNVLTPVVKPGEDVRVELVVDRRQRCDQEISRFVHYPGNDRDAGTRELPSTYGRMGRDVYVVRIPTSPKAPFGAAEVYSTGKAKCNPWQRYVKEVESGDPWHDYFRFGPETVTVPGKHDGMSRGEN